MSTPRGSRGNSPRWGSPQKLDFNILPAEGDGSDEESFDPSPGPGDRLFDGVDRDLKAEGGSQSSCARDHPETPPSVCSPTPTTGSQTRGGFGAEGCSAVNPAPLR
ncbi:hypothetical protein GQ55_3G304700 [Panicum hallii var. hallii]|uniref:Uncharacterized protein n=1 Tax=Panicum hallii var. hallii TaxID=1504633 RepID=A0A2T7EEZ3_9POAL|nr:hypothetical protein GQ55_3G304700 [Panicum hallii var. hallii]